MSKLSDLLTAVVAARERGGPVNFRYGYIADDELLDYLVSHAAEYAERERLERRCVSAWIAYDNGHSDHSYAAMLDTKEELVSWLVKYADMEDRP